MTHSKGRLVLVEGLPGTGKTPTTRFLKAALDERGVTCHAFYEASPDNPIAIGSVNEDLAGVITGYQNKADFLADWRTLASSSRTDDVVILESRFIQNAGMFLFLAGASPDDVVRHTTAITAVLAGARPILVYLQAGDPAAHMEQVLRASPQQWVERVIAAWNSTSWVTKRGLKDQDGFLEFFRHWAPMLESLVERLRIDTVRVEDARTAWPQAISRIVERIVNESAAQS